MSPLPTERRVLAGRTFSRAWDAAESGAAIEVCPRRGLKRPIRGDVWDSPEVGAAIQRFRRRARLADRLCWLAAFGLLIATAALAWWP